MGGEACCVQVLQTKRSSGGGAVTLKSCENVRKDEENNTRHPRIRKVNVAVAESRALRKLNKFKLQILSKDKFQIDQVQNLPPVLT